jgi:transcriptional regulator with XRE-family HTH domain
MPGQTAGETAAYRIREVRERRNWNQERLADALAEIGHPVDRSVIARIEARQGTKVGTAARNITVERLLAFAVALGVSPVELIVPQSEDTDLMIGTEAIDPKTARTWIRQGAPLDGSDWRVYFSERPEWEFKDAIVQAKAVRVAGEVGESKGVVDE